MYRTHTCGELRISDAGKQVTLSGWVQRVRDLGGMTFLDLRDRYGITQIVVNSDTQPVLSEQVRQLGREYVVQVSGTVTERASKNSKIPTGDIEIALDKLVVLNESALPPFTIEDDTDGGDELRMKYRYLDLRRGPLKRNLELRHRMSIEIRNYLNERGFLDVETPVLIKSTPEGARDFVVPSRVHPGQFYALPQSPQMFKQLLMVAGYDRYFQIVKCFRDEDLRADRQPEFTQVDCEMAFVERDDVLDTFEGLTKHIFKVIRGIEYNEPFPRLSYADAMSQYGSDKPDIRFGMKIKEITEVAKGKGFKVFDEAEYVGGFCAEGQAEMSRKELDNLTDFVKRPQIGGKGLIYVKYNADGTVKSSVDKFFDEAQLKGWAESLQARPGDLLLIMAGDKKQTLGALGDLRLEVAGRLGLRNKDVFAPLWVVDFPLLEWDEESQRFFAMHHPFTSPVKEDIELLNTNPGKVRANAYDLVINGVELGGGSIRIHDKALQQRMFEVLGFTDEQAQDQFGFLMNAFRFGAPPHGGIAFGFDRWTSLMAGLDSIRDVIAFPKNNAARDMMIDSPSPIDDKQLNELFIKLDVKE
ncbi:aspartate--tRNA ligase [Xiashengella succiniciproducens]|jgi:aspartyl-tRNA synthetase|uniref:Aspartate--tRNA ligase n=1 Tax=Xiashengella succiniciproducens TaxID=2949635 RepID=A0A9J6ZT25_9BACT|nr:aspartate--tRNA ligase [Alkaliflexus sp. Ai-910]MDI9538486.1 aspartate--tRNA ligase [Bacteroidota bacterium]URW80400.1 aspartate--tRNA ligase [Alkaliflexus sp. Ai-910]